MRQIGKTSWFLYPVIATYHAVHGSSWPKRRPLLPVSGRESPLFTRKVREGLTTILQDRVSSNNSSQCWSYNKDYKQVVQFRVFYIHLNPLKNLQKLVRSQNLSSQGITISKECQIYANLSINVCLA